MSRRQFHSASYSKVLWVEFRYLGCTETQVTSTEVPNHLQIRQKSYKFQGKDLGISHRSQQAHGFEEFFEALIISG